MRRAVRIVSLAAATDQLQATGLAGFLWEDSDSDDSLYMVHAKYRLVDSSQLHLALQGGAMFVDHTTTGTVGIIGSVCFDSTCGSMLNGFVGYAAERDGSEDRFLVFNASLISRLSRHVELVMEIDSVSVSDQDETGVLGFYGVRLTSGTWAGDLGLARPLGEWSDEGFGPGLPMISLTYRAQ